MHGTTDVQQVRRLLRALNRTQRLVLLFFAVAWMGLVAILVTDPGVYDRAFGTARRGVVEPAFLVGVSILVAGIGVGVVRRWRWLFWLLVAAFLAGLLRVPASMLAIRRIVSADGPTWYLLLQAVIGAVQFATGVAMLLGYRRAGVWGAF